MEKSHETYLIALITSLTSKNNKKIYKKNNINISTCLMHKIINFQFSKLPVNSYVYIDISWTIFILLLLLFS